MDEPMAMNLRGRDEGARPELDTLASLRAADGGSSRSYVLAPSSAASADSTTDSPEQGSSMCSCAKPTSGGGLCCGHDSPGCRCTTTYEAYDAMNDVATPLVPTLGQNTGQSTGRASLIFSAAGSPARTSASPDAAPGSPVNDPASSTSSPASLSLFDPDGYSSRTYPGSSARTAVGTSESLLERWPTSGTAWAGGFSTAVSSECRSDADGCSSSEPSLGMILEPPLSVPARYSLSGRAARGILRRAEKRGRTLPGHLAAALESVAGLRTPNE